MREILFRGKRKDNSEWIQGDFCSPCNIVFLENGYDAVLGKDDCPMCNDFEVIPETVGQYTGLTDKNGKKIFEGDIVHAIYKSGYTGISDKDFGIGVIKYSGTYYSGAAYQIDIIGEPGCRIFSASLQVEVIGNIHDNPELLKGADVCKT